MAPPLTSAATTPSRWSASAWLFVREGSGAALAAGGALGGSQAGGRFGYQLTETIGASARAYAPLDGRGAEAAIGITWQPLAAVPATLLVERRVGLDRDGRSAFAVLGFGGIGDRRIAGPLIADAYVQAGIVGARSGDAFADAAIRLSAAATPALAVGGGLWGAVQPGVTRLDVGPQVSVRVPIKQANLRLLADWRIRIAGEARPASGPSLTLASDF